MALSRFFLRSSLIPIFVLILATVAPGSPVGLGPKMKAAKADPCAVTVPPAKCAIPSNKSNYDLVVNPLKTVCAPTCLGLKKKPPVLSRLCALCITNAMLTNVLSDWPRTQDRIQRLALYELGLTNVPALAVVEPSMYSVSNPKMAEHFWYAITTTYKFCAKNVTICDSAIGGCKTKDVGPAYKLDLCPENPANSWGGQNLNPFCSQKAATPAIPVDSPEQLALFFANTTGVARGDWCMQRYTRTAQATARRVMTNVTAAEIAFWEIAQPIIWNTLFFRKVSPSDTGTMARLRKLYGADWLSSYDSLAERGALFEYDLTFLQGFNPQPGKLWSIAAHILCVSRRMTVNPSAKTAEIVPLAIRLSNVNGTSTAATFTHAKSESAWILALYIARAAFTQTATWFGHVFHFHVPVAAASRALFNTIETKRPIGNATNPFRQFLERFLNPAYCAEFNTQLFALAYPSSAQNPLEVPPTPIMTDNLPYVWDLYAKGGPLGVTDPNWFYRLTPAAMLQRGGLAAADFTSSGGTPWDLYPGAQRQLQMFDLAKSYASGVLKTLYPSDQAVVTDASVQAFIKDLNASTGSNLRVSASGGISTVADLIELSAHLIYACLAHATSRIPEYTLPNILGVAMNPPRVELNVLPNPKGSYSLSQMLTYAPSLATQNAWSNFIYTFIAAPPMSTLIPPAKGNIWSGQADYTKDLPFKISALNDKLVTFRKAVASWTASTDPSGMVRNPPSGPLCHGPAWFEETPEF